MSNSDIVSGTLDLLILKTLSEGPLHGYGIAKRIRSASADVLRIGDNVLYPALHRLADRGELSGRWGTTDSGREARIYRLTRKGRTRLDRESARWRERSEAALRILGGDA
ncbi:MAG: PadR family transcriptional regulator [Longimicrobiales bacterium]